MDKKEIIRRLKRMSEHAVYMPGRPLFIMSLDDGVAADEAAILLKEQEAVKIKVDQLNGSGRCGRCPNCRNELNETDYPNYCGFCGRAVKWDN